MANKSPSRGSLNVVLVQAAEFLAEFSWIYNFANVKIFSCESILDIPRDWLDFLSSVLHPAELKSLLKPSSSAFSAAPHFFSEFVRRRNDLYSRLLEQFSIQDTVDDDEQADQTLLPNHIKRGMSLKKQHEVVRFCQHIASQVSPSDGHLVDVGSGLGYMVQVLGACLNYSVLGVESRASLSAKAELRPGVSAGHQQIVFTLDNRKDSFRQLELQLSVEGKEQIYLIALHACGDLSAALLNWFATSDRVGGLSIVSCCYHKMNSSSSFPLSQEFARVLALVGDTAHPVVGVFARRLAAQGSMQKWLEASELDHAVHTKQFGVRAALEVVICRGLYQVKRTTGEYRGDDRVRCELSCRRFFVNQVEVPLCRVESELNAAIEHYQDQFWLLELLTGLQAFLQIIIELVIVCDRLMYLKECGYKASAKRLFHCSKSPRGLVISCYKNNLAHLI